MKGLVVKIKEGKGPGSYSYKNEINAEDFKQIATILMDLETQGLPMKKAVLEFRKILGEEAWIF